MNSSTQNILRKIIPIFLLLLIAAVCYMSLAHLFGFYNDDWYLIYSATSQGIQKFHDIFAIDRPFRGYFVGWMYNLFGLNPWLYSLGAFIMRCVSALGFLWILRIVWPVQKKATFVAALLFLVYPGFLDQPNAIDFQSHQWAFALAILSIGCTLQMTRSKRPWVKVVWIILSIITQITYLALMEYYIGMEGLRYLLFTFVNMKQYPAERKNWIRVSILGLVPTTLVAIGFLYWRTQIFQAERLDINAMFSTVEASPALRLVWMVIYMFKNMLNTIIYAWTEPVYQYAFAVRLKYLIVEISLAILAGLITWVALFAHRNYEIEGQNQVRHDNTAIEMLIIGLLAVMIALVPIILGNRQIIFESYSRFSLPVSAGAILVLTGCWLFIKNVNIANAIIVVLVTLATMVHIGNAYRYAENWKIVRNFWWQVSWRVPQIKPGTVLMGDYAGKGVPEDYFIWGPANLIYYPKLNPQDPTNLTITAATLNHPDIISVLSQSVKDTERRNILSHSDFNQLLVMTMPTEFSCVHVLDGENLELSDNSLPEIMTIAPYSRLDRIELNNDMVTPPKSIFGEEPAEGWCYYYEKADLARQRGDWKEITRLGDIVSERDLRPYDWIEWMPFIEGYAAELNEEKVTELGLIIKANPFYGYQACKLVETDARKMAVQFPEGYQLLVQELCQK